MRDDSPQVKWYVDNNLDTWTISHPRFFEETYKAKPVVLELQHYHMIKEDGNWLGLNGEKTIPNINESGADIFRNAIKTMHATYIGFHGYLGEWLSDNPDLTGELLNLSGYWYFPESLEIMEIKKSSLSFNIKWLNKGLPLLILNTL